MGRRGDGGSAELRRKIGAAAREKKWEKERAWARVKFRGSWLFARVERLRALQPTPSVWRLG
jgi:hypothetical protein